MTDEKKICAKCKYEEDSFACKIRHLQINSGTAKASNDGNSKFGLTEQR